MKYDEKLTWILDRKNKKIGDEKAYQENIDFVHSLGKKCDCVGWSELDMNDTDADSVLDAIQNCCKENGWLARGIYERVYTDIVSDWYELKTEYFKDNTICSPETVMSDSGDEINLDVIRAYRELKPAPKERFGIYVSERFRNACMKHNIADVDFCWIQDNGKYEAEQYFYIQPGKNIPRIAYGRELDVSKIDRLQALGGFLPKIGSVFYNLQLICLQDCYLKEDMPDGGIAYVYCPSGYHFAGRYKILIHKDIAELLIAEKALARSALTPAYVAEECPAGYILDATAKKPKIPDDHIQKSLLAFERLKAKNRPQYIISEKEAVKFLRKAKNERKKEFNKKIKADYVWEIENSAHKAVLSYYMVCDGGLLSDEYTFLSYCDSLTVTEEFFASLQKEELLQDKPVGIVIATCIDGDFVLVREDGTVIRFSHEAPECVNEWQSVANFFVDALNDNE